MRDVVELVVPELQRRGRYRKDTAAARCANSCSAPRRACLTPTRAARSGAGSNPLLRCVPQLEPERITMKRRTLLQLAAGGRRHTALHCLLPPRRRQSTAPLEELRLDYAYYSPTSLVLRRFGWLEQEFKPTARASNGCSAPAATARSNT
jgi:hypothetical protein